MSLDYESYLEIKRQSRILGVVWKIADGCYYIGLLGAVVVPLVFLLKALLVSSKHEPLRGGLLSYFATAAIFCGLFVVLFFASTSVKGAIRERLKKP